MPGGDRLGMFNGVSGARGAPRGGDGAVSLANFLTYTRKISFDLIVETMYQTGKDLSKIYRETSEGGLAKLYKPAQKNESTEEIK